MRRGRKKRNRDDDFVPPEVLQSILLMVAQQMDDMDPPEVRQTYNRLIALGLSESQALEQLMFAYMGESIRSQAQNDEFNLANYVLNLTRLPLPLYDNNKREAPDETDA